jgi:hypothetical protein
MSIDTLDFIYKTMIVTMSLLTVYGIYITRKAGK